MGAATNIQNKPRVVLGLLTFGPPGTEENGSRVTDINVFNDFLNYYQHRGYNEVDTARTYVKGLQEGFTRDAKWRERGLSLATKWYPQKPGDHSKENVKKHLEKSLSELGTDKVNIFYLHAPDRSIPFEETLEACNELYQAGKFEKLGLSNYASWEVAEIYNICKERGWVRPSVYQAMYNLLQRAIEEELVPCCKKYRIDVLMYNPLAGGLLSGKYKAGEVPSDGSRFSGTDPVVGKQYRKRYFKDANFEALRMLEPVAEEHGLSLLEIALRWLVHHSKLGPITGNDGIVIGVSSLKQLESNLNDLEKGPLPDDVVKVLDEIWENVTKASCPLYWR